MYCVRWLVFKQTISTTDNQLDYFVIVVNACLYILESINEVWNQFPMMFRHLEEVLFRHHETLQRM